MKLNTLTRVAVAGALGAVLELCAAFKLPVLFPSFLKVDFGDVLPLLVALTTGFRAGLWTEGLKVGLHMLIKGGNLVGNSANLLAGVAFLLPILLLEGTPRTRREAWLPLLLCPISAALLMWPANAFVFLPLRGTTGTAAHVMALSTLVPFNLLKFGLSAAVAHAVLPTIATVLGSDRDKRAVRSEA